MVNYKKALAPMAIDRKEWTREWPYDEWRAVVFFRKQYATENLLQTYYNMRWDPDYTRDWFDQNRLWTRRPRARAKPRIISLTAEQVQRRFAQACLRECNRLLLRELAPDAKAVVIEQRNAMERFLGIDRVAE